MNIHLIPSIGTSQDALDAERTRLDMIASNLANAQTTRDINGNVYRRKLVSFESYFPKNQGDATLLPVPSVRVSQIRDDQRPLTQVYMPGHPEADEKGLVTLPNVNVVEEMVDMMTASRSFEANLQVLQSARQMFLQSMRIIQSS